MSVYRTIGPLVIYKIPLRVSCTYAEYVHTFRVRQANAAHTLVIRYAYASHTLSKNPGEL